MKVLIFNPRKMTYNTKAAAYGTPYKGFKRRGQSTIEHVTHLVSQISRM